MSAPELLARILSFEKPDVTYDITRQDGVLACDCPAFGFSKERPQTCKHLRLYLFAQRVVTRCRQRHGTPGRLVCEPCLLELLVAAARKSRKRERRKKGLRSGREQI